MPPNHFAVLWIEQLLTETGYKIMVGTDVPCHLWMRWTTIEPRFHSLPHMKRGEILFCDVQFCFVSYKDNEQVGPGDTLIHTFIKEPWPVCETRWFIFWGTIGGEQSPSTSGLFKKHRKAPLLPEPTDDKCIDPTVNGGYLQEWNADGQIIKPVRDYTLRGLSVRLNQRDTDRKGPVMIKFMTDDGPHEEGSVLWETEVYSLECPEPGSQEWTYFGGIHVPLTAGTSYRIVIHTIRPWYWWNGREWESYEGGAAMMWWSNGREDEYPRGDRCWGWNFRTHSGTWESSWQARNFICYG